jgi:hypothetical protein
LIWSRPGPHTGSDSIITNDTQRFTQLLNPPSGWNGATLSGYAPSGMGVGNTCPQCSWTGVAIGNVDNDAALDEVVDHHG